jgi:hypothetical protein
MRHDVSLVLTGAPPYEEGMPRSDYEMFPLGLALVHQVLLRNTRRIADLARGAPRADPPAVARYTRHFLKLLELHHVGEDRFVFPAIRTASGGRSADLAFLDRFAREHEDVVALMDEIEHGLGAVGRGDPPALRSLARGCDALLDLLVPHLAAEEQALTAETLPTLIDAPALAAATDAMRAHDEREGGPPVLMLLWQSLAPAERADLLGELPWFVRRVLLGGVWRLTHPAVARLAPLAP